MIDRSPTAELCTDDMQVGHTTHVEGYSSNVSPYGALDLAGDVGECTSSVYRPYPYRTDDGREDPTNEEARVVRGGAYNLTRWNARCACRLRYARDRRRDHEGFRVVLSPADGEKGAAFDPELASDPGALCVSGTNAPGMPGKAAVVGAWSASKPGVFSWPGAVTRVLPLDACMPTCIGRLRTCQT